VAVAGSAVAATVTWNQVQGAVGYSVKRWKQDDLKCCNNEVQGLSVKALTWTDEGANREGFPLAGVYVFQVTVTMDNGTSGATVVNWQRPDPAPVGSRASQLAARPLQTVGLAAPTGAQRPRRIGPHLATGTGRDRLPDRCGADGGRSVESISQRPNRGDPVLLYPAANMDT
jgi:hypothetical protein